jgi:nicotinamide riboside transporter PnuC
MKKIIYLLPILFFTQPVFANYGLDILGKNLVTFTFIFACIPFAVGALAVIFTKKRKTRAFFIGLLTSALILTLFVFLSS